MRTLRDIEELLTELDSQAADALEDQDLDFKQWDAASMDKAVRLVVHMAVCMANGGGGTVVFGVADKSVGRSTAILGVPPEVDVNRLKKAVYDQTDPKIMPVFEELRVPEGTGRLLVMQIHPGMPPYTAQVAWCRPLREMGGKTMRNGSTSGSHRRPGPNTAPIGPLIGSAPSRGPIECMLSLAEGDADCDGGLRSGHAIPLPIRVHSRSFAVLPGS